LKDGSLDGWALDSYTVCANLVHGLVIVAYKLFVSSYVLKGMATGKTFLSLLMIIMFWRTFLLSLEEIDEMVSLSM